MRLLSVTQEKAVDLRNVVESLNTSDDGWRDRGVLDPVKNMSTTTISGAGIAQSV